MVYIFRVEAKLADYLCLAYLFDSENGGDASLGTRRAYSSTIFGQISRGKH
jgi:hypothetical protein